MTSGLRPTLGGSSLLWLMLGAWQALALLTVIVVASLQYFGRRTAWSRAAIAAFGGVGFLAPLLMGFSSGYALQRALGPELPPREPLHR